MSRYYLGIDPGATGAAALLRWDGNLRLCDLSGEIPVIVDRLRELVSWAGNAEILCACERAQTMPRQGIVSAFHYGIGYGAIQAFVYGAGISWKTVRPAEWKKAMGLSADKKESLKMARELYPLAELPLQKHHGRAEAILLAHAYRAGQLAFNAAKGGRGGKLK